jgi:cytochrome d ubiquinol oxidase subunit II
MAFNVVWFVLWGVLWAVYFMLDGFVFGTGMLHLALGRNDTERRILIRSVGPVWNGNEVWLITAGGATFAAFPTTYALMFSYLYTALLLLLFSLIIRGVSLEFRNKRTSRGWTTVWDIGVFIGGVLPALLFGVAFGNIFRGLPMDATGYHGNLISLLNPYGLLTGVLFVLMFLVHGSLYISVKTEGDIRQRALASARGLWIALLVVAVAFLVATAFATKLAANFLRAPIFILVPLVAVVALLGSRFFLAKDSAGKAFASSCVMIVMVVATGVIGLFPNLIPSSLDPAYSLTIDNSSSSPYTLRIMTVVAAIFVPIVILYKIWAYSAFRAKVTPAELGKEEEAY